MTTLQLPMKFGESKIDLFAASYTSQFPVIKTGSMEVTYDGFGTLITPTGIYKNVIRLKSIQIDKDSVAKDLGAGISIVNNVKGTFYSYYISGNTNPLFAIYYINQNEIDYDPISYLYDAEFLTATTTSFKNNLLVNIFPNPTTDVLFLDFSKSSEKFFDITIFNQIGMKVYTNKVVRAEKDIFQIPLDNLQKGPYIMKISSENSYTVEKILIH